MAVTRDAAVMLVDGRMLADMDLGDPTGPVAMYSTAPDEPDWAAGIAAAGAAAVRRRGKRGSL